MREPKWLWPEDQNKHKEIKYKSMTDIDKMVTAAHAAKREVWKTEGVNPTYLLSREAGSTENEVIRALTWIEYAKRHLDDALTEGHLNEAKFKIELALNWLNSAWKEPDEKTT